MLHRQFLALEHQRGAYLAEDNIATATELETIYFT